MNITTLWNNYYINSGVENHAMQLYIAKSINFVIQNYFLTWSNFFVLTVSCRHRQSCRYFNDILEQSFDMWGTSLRQFVVIPKTSKIFVDGRRYCNVILTDSFEAFLAIDIIQYTRYYDHNEYYHIFLQSSEASVHENMHRILEYCWANQIINCNVQIQNVEGDILIYTYFPFTPQHCGIVVPVLFNQFNGASLVLHELFPKKLRNLYGCALRAALWDEPPFVDLNNYENGTSRLIGGFEGNLLLELALRMNFTIEIKVPPNDEKRGRFIGNVVNGALGMLHNQSADFSLGCFRQTAIRSANATSVASFYQSTQRLTLLISAYEFSSLQILLFPFEATTWTLFIAIIAFFILFLKFINIYYVKHPHLLPGLNPAYSYLNLLLSIVGMPIPFMPSRNYTRILYICCLFFTLVIRTTYEALLFHLIRTHATNHLPETFDELIAEDYIVVMNLATYQSLKDVPFLARLSKIVVNTTSQIIGLEYMENKKQKGYVALAMVDFVLYYGRQNMKVGVFKILPQTVLNLQVTMYLSKHSFLIDHFQDEIIWIRAAGFIEAWTRSVLNDDYYQSTNFHTDKVFGLHELHMLFVIQLTGLSIALFIFLMEILSKRIQFLRKIFLIVST